MSRFSPAGPSNSRSAPPPKLSIDAPGRATASPPAPVFTEKYEASSELKAALRTLREYDENANNSNKPIAKDQKQLEADAALYAGPNLNVTAKLHSPYLPLAGERATEALLMISTPADVGVRQPFELLVVLDNSGSMQGERLVNCKQAITQIIRSMSDGDILHFVIYSDTARTIFVNGKSSDADSLISQVESISTAGSTNISAGMLKAFNILAGKPMTSRRVFLFSDGEANAGVQLVHEMEQVIRFMHSKGVNVTSFGIGDSYNEQLMRAIAIAGHGDFFYIDKASNIPSIVAKGMAVLTTLVATNMTLTLTPLNGTIVNDIIGYSSSSMALLGDISSDDMRQVLVSLVCPAPSAAARVVDSKADLFYYRISFLQPGSNNPYFLQGTVACTFTDETVKLAETDSDVAVALAIANASAVDAKVYDLLESNRFADARAMKKAAIDKLETFAAVDKSGFVPHLVRLGRAAEASMAQSKVNVAEVKKAVHWTAGASIVHRKCF